MPVDPKALTPPPLKIPLADSTGLASQAWSLFFQSLISRVGGLYSDSLSTVASNQTGIQATVTALQASDTSQNADIALLEKETAENTAAINDLQVTDGTWSPVLTNASVTGTVALTGSYRIVAGEVFWQVLIDASAGSLTSSGTMFGLGLSATYPATFATVNISAYADYGNGLVQNDTATLPHFTLMNQVAIASGRYKS